MKKKLFGLILFFVLYINAKTIIQLKQPKTSPTDGPLTEHFLNYIKTIFNLNTLIETGTFHGHTIKNATNIFSSIHSIELSNYYYSQALKIFKNQKHIHLYNDHSPKALEYILKNTKENILFWLDAHWMGTQQTAKYNSNTPIIAELEIIKKAGIKNSVILIDDLRLFQSHTQQFPAKSTYIGYPNFSELIQKIKEINSQYKVLVYGDCALAYLKNPHIEASPILKILTKSRKAEDKNKYPINLEEQLQTASTQEKKFIKNLALQFQDNPTMTIPQYKFWYAMTQLKKGKFQKAKMLLNSLAPINYQKEKVNYYLAFCINKLS